MQKIIGKVSTFFAFGLNFNLSQSALHSLRAQNLNENLKGQFGARATLCEATIFHAYYKSLAFCRSIVHSRHDVADSQPGVFMTFIALLASSLLLSSTASAQAATRYDLNCKHNVTVRRIEIGRASCRERGCK